MGWRISLFACAFSIAGCTTAALASELHDAARSGDLQQLKQLLDSGGNLEDRDRTQETPLLSAALVGQAAAVEELLKRGADITARNDRGMTALHAAAYGGSLESVTLLVNAGAAVNDADDKFKVTPLIVAAEENHADVVQFLAEHNADLSLRERHGFTALTRAGFKRRWDTIQVLLKSGGECQSAKVAGDWWATQCAIQVIKEVTNRLGGSP